mgnify:CR=1 FL=1
MAKAAKPDGARRCADCPEFRIRYEPYKSGGYIWDFGLAECRKHGLVVDFASERKLNGLTCVEESATREREE